MTSEPVLLPAIPFELFWEPGPEHWEPMVSASAGQVGLVVEAGPGTDLFASPDGLAPVTNAPRLLGVPDRYFQLSALIDVELGATFDAAALVVWAEPGSWAKVGLERTPTGSTAVVSVVTRDLSDDANGIEVVGSSGWLRVSRSSNGSYSFHSAPDGVHWTLVRHFRLGAPPRDPIRLGFLAQSPTGEGCRATFSQLRYLPEGVDDVHSGD